MEKVQQVLNAMNDIIDFWIKKDSNLSAIYFYGYSKEDVKIVSKPDDAIIEKAKEVLRKYDTVKHKSISTKVIYLADVDTMLLLKNGDDTNLWEVESGIIYGKTISTKHYQPAINISPFMPWDSDKVFAPIEVITICKKIVRYWGDDSGKRLTVKNFRDNIPARLTKIHTYLKNDNLINCNIDVWLYWFGEKELNSIPEKIQWLGADYILSNLIKQLCDNGGEKYIGNAFKFNIKYLKSTYKDYKTGNFYKKIDSYMNFAITKI